VVLLNEHKIQLIMIKKNLLMIWKQILNELQTRLQAFADCLQEEEQVAAAQRIKKQQTNGNK
jgi:hypothetical protein